MVQAFEQRRRLAALEYPSKYENIIRQWKQEGEDAFWLIYSANYLFRWGGVRWAVDPVTLSSRIPAEFPVQPEIDFENADFIVLTHRHADHLDLKLLHSISKFNIPWVIPAFLLHKLIGIIRVPDHRIIVPKPGEQIELSGIKILPMEGSHWENLNEQRPEGNTLHGVPSYSYLFEVNHKRWFIPGDTRTYNVTQIPSLGPLDGLIAHVWLGRKGALMDPPPLLDQFCNYHLAFNSPKIVLTHLDEWGRNESGLWTNHHAEMIIDKIKQSSNSISIAIANTGDRVSL